MTNLSRLRQLDPELADWWIERRREAWSEVGLVRPTDADDVEKAVRDTAGALATGKRALALMKDQVEGTFSRIAKDAKITAESLNGLGRNCGLRPRRPEHMRGDP